jgi:Family of unknown function (DUF6220)
VSTLDDAQTVRKESGLIRWARIAVVALAWLFAAGVVVQVFLAGLSLFESPDYWEDHKSLGRSLGVIPILLILVALVGRLPVRLIGMASVLLVLFGVQYLLANIDEGYLAALHPVNAFVLFGISTQLGANTHALLNSSS